MMVRQKNTKLYVHVSKKSSVVVQWLQLYLNIGGCGVPYPRQVHWLRQRVHYMNISSVASVDRERERIVVIRRRSSRTVLNHD